MYRDCNSVRGSFPSQLVDRPLRQDESCARTGAKVEHSASGQDLVFNRTTQNDVDEVLEVFVSRYDACRNRVVLNGQASPAYRRTRQSGMGMQERFNPSLTYH